ncbi:MAG: protein ClrD [Betaproteobacteria bacterium]|nr:MAG: protein ClrD [Betaproteobacteria bacterium]
MNPTARARQYLTLAQLFSFPRPEVWQPLERDGVIPARSQDEREADYLATFELGGKQSAVPLYEGLCRPVDGREGILEDVMRFHEFFGVRLQITNRDYPDHLVTELEFMAFLCQQEAAGKDVDSFRRASRDFLRRHLLAWVPGFAERLAGGKTDYGEIALALADFCQEHADELEEMKEGVLP